MKALVFLLISASVLWSAPAIGGLPAVAVSPFQGESVLPQDLATATGRFRDALLETGAYQILEKEKAAALQGEKALAQSGCVATSCFAELGEELGAAKVVLGRISKIGNLIAMEARLVDVASGKVEKVVGIDSDKSMAKAIRTDLLTLAEMLAGAPVLNVPGVKDTTRKSIAVLDIESNGVDSSTVRGLTQKLRTQLFMTGRFEVMERDEMDEILKEQAFQQTVCSGDECSVKMGQLAGVDLMVGGSVSRIGPMHSVSARIIDVGTGRILRSSTVDVNGNMETVLTETMDDVARTLAGMEVKRRVNVPAWVWVGVGALLTGAGGYMHFQAIQDNRSYDKERQDIDRLLQLKESAQTSYTAAFGLYGAASLSFGISTWLFLAPQKEIRVRDLQSTSR